MAHYWKTLPLSDILVIDGAEYECPSGYEKLFTREWPGTENGCDCRGVYHRYIPASSRGKITKGYCNRNETRYGCDDIWSLSPLDLDIVGGHLYCGKRADTNFIELTRVGLDGECPKDYVACNPDAYIDNKYCFISLEDCPIN